jgi:hypothetical protein
MLEVVAAAMPVWVVMLRFQELQSQGGVQLEEGAVVKQRAAHQVDHLEVQDPSFKVVVEVSMAVVVVDIMVAAAMLSVTQRSVVAAAALPGLVFSQMYQVQTAQICIVHQVRV